MAAALVAAGIAGARSFEARQWTIRSGDLPPEFDGFKIAFVSDLHSGAPFAGEAFSRALAAIEAFEPDLVLFGGDFVESDPGLFHDAFARCAALSAPVYGVLGNHDHRAGASRAFAEAAAAGFTLVDAGGAWIERGAARVRLAGFGDYQHGRTELPASLDGAIPGDYVVALAHNPDSSLAFPPGLVDLALFGHVHGGQIAPFGLPVLVRTKTRGAFIDGLYRVGGASVVVSRGLGCSIVPLRIGATPTVELLTLRRERVAGSGT